MDSSSMAERIEGDWIHNMNMGGVLFCCSLCCVCLICGLARASPLYPCPSNLCLFSLLRLVGFLFTFLIIFLSTFHSSVNGWSSGWMNGKKEGKVDCK